MEITATLTELLGPSAVRELEGIDPSRLTKTLQALESCAGALQLVDALDVTPHELAEVGTADLTVWSAIAGDVSKVLVTVQQTLAFLRQLFPSTGSSDLNAASDDISIEDMFGTEEGSGVWSEHDLDTVVLNAIGTSETEMGDAVKTLAAMLHGDVVAFGQQLRRPEIVGDRWSLLGLVQEFKTSCEQCLEAVVASILGSVMNRNLDNLLPRYRRAAAHTVELRRVLVALSYDVSRFNMAIQPAEPHELPALKDALEQRLGEFMASAGSRYIRATDKRLIVVLRVFLRDWPGTDVPAMKAYIDDVTKSIELLRGISQREVLQKHDAEALDAAIALLNANATIPEALPFIEKAYGRAPELDGRIYYWQLRQNMDPADAIAVLRQVRSTIPLPPT